MAKLGGKGLFDRKEEYDEERTTMGRPKIHVDIVEKITLTLNKDLIDALDRIGLAIRINKRKVVDRGAIVRAMLKMCLSLKIDLNYCESEAEVEKKLMDSIHVNEKTSSHPDR